MFLSFVKRLLGRRPPDNPKTPDRPDPPTVADNSMQAVQPSADAATDRWTNPQNWSGGARPARCGPVVFRTKPPVGANTASVFLVLLGCAVLSNVSPAQEPPAQKPAAQEAPKVPEGVILVALPPGDVWLANVEREKKPVLRLTCGKLVIEAKTMYFGDQKGAIQIETIKEGMHWVPPEGGRGVAINGSMQLNGGANRVESPKYLRPHQLPPGSVFIISPTVRFLFGVEATPRPQGK